MFVGGGILVAGIFFWPLLPVGAALMIGGLALRIIGKAAGASRRFQKSQGLGNRRAQSRQRRELDLRQEQLNQQAVMHQQMAAAGQLPPGVGIAPCGHAVAFVDPACPACGAPTR